MMFVQRFWPPIIYYERALVRLGFLFDITASRRRFAPSRSYHFLYAGLGSGIQGLALAQSEAPHVLPTLADSSHESHVGSYT